MIINYNNLDPLLLKIQASMFKTKFILILNGFALMIAAGLGFMNLSKNRSEVQQCLRPRNASTWQIGCQCNSYLGCIGSLLTHLPSYTVETGYKVNACKIKLVIKSLF